MSSILSLTIHDRTIQLPEVIAWVQPETTTRHVVKQSMKHVCNVCGTMANLVPKPPSNSGLQSVGTCVLC